MSQDRNQDHLYPLFAQKLRVLERKLRDAGFAPVMVEGLRSAKYQNELYQQGRTKPGKRVTNADGYKKPSNHQSGLAADYVNTDIRLKVLWDDIKFYRWLGKYAKELGLEWGGLWKSIVDMPHVQWPASDTKTYALAKQWLKENGLL